MRRLLCTALLLLCCAYGCIAAVVQPLPQKGQGPWDTYTLSVTETELERKKEGFQPIRFAVSAKEIDRVLKYCKHHKDGKLDDAEKDQLEYGFKIDIEKHDDFCDEAGPNVVTPEKKRTLLRDVLPVALKLHSERLSVKRVEKLELPLKESVEFSSKCPNVSVPKEHKQGISDADFMLYVGLTEKYVPVQICSYDTQERPTSALIKFIPKEIDDTRYFIRLTAHEVAHALGFEIEMMKKHNVIAEENTGTNKDQLVASNALIDKKMKEQYDCSKDDDVEIKGMPSENKASETGPLHWKRLIAKDELMSPYTPDDKYVTGAYYTSLTLAVFHSMPFYSANFSMAESMSWGKNAGCEFLKGKDKETYKGTKSNKYSEMFCDKVEPALQCTSDRFALGMCSMETSGVEVHYEYGGVFVSVLTKRRENDLMDGYSIIKPIPETSCEEDELDLMPGSLVGKESRCLKGEGLKLQIPNKKNLPVGDICAKVKCEKNKVFVWYNGTNDWQECSDGKKIDVKDSTEFTGGSIVCPNYAEVCTELNSTVDFYITYDEDEKRQMEKEKQEAEDKRKQEEEERHRIMAQEAHNERIQRDAQPEDQTPLHPDPKQNTPSKPAEDSAGDSSGKQSLRPSQDRNQRDSAGVGQDGVVSSLPAAPQSQPAREENRALENSNNNNGDEPHQQPSISAPNVPSDTKTSEMEKNSSEPAKAQDKEVSISEMPTHVVPQEGPSVPQEPEVEKLPTTETPTHVAFESIAASEQTSSVKEEGKKNTAENIEQVQETITESPSHNGNGEGINTTVDTTHSPNSPATDNEKNETIVNTHNNTSNTTSSSIPENVNASAVPATLTELNNTQMGQVINQATTIAIVGADSSIAASYQIPLLLLFSALVALASP
ncbi:surface protease GP63 [Trypanosoma theileri]|uniref:Leishmanolysin-like peptidase n=1 Tax=Trypanosoma theileri TaxID=67003 RepID=A0A1X0NP64_9TRYP|nr:surface protease GP63 [Trypanosoma theileri]ORC85920.1 surface protease GP63 [Trypanosoma theileri]